MFQVSCGLTYAPEYVHCLEYHLHIAAAYSHNATSKKFQVSCSIHIYSLRYVGNWKQLPLHNSSCIDTLSPQVSLLSSNFRLVKWDVQSFLYEPKLRISQWTRRPQIYSSFATSPGLSADLIFVKKFTRPNFQAEKFTH